MASVFDDLVKITEPDTPREVRLVAMRDFAEHLKWTPSYELHASFGVPGAGDHVVVEHGLSNSAVISFLRGSARASQLDGAQLRALLSISYNNLVDWHIFVSQGDIRRVNNLVDPTTDSSADVWSSLSPSTFLQQLSAAGFSDVSEFETRRKTLRSCDDALIGVISRWKRLLKADYPAATNQALSTLFNGLIFVRGCEDRRLDIGESRGRLLLKILSEQAGDQVDLRQALLVGLQQTNVRGELGDYIDLSQMDAFTSVDRYTALDLFRDFYAPSEAAYDFNFALMSKHALSRIYERFVALLVPDAQYSDQLAFIAPTPIEQAPSRTGSIYTPQFIAGFFARYIRENTTPKRFRTLRSLDPACGSGIFLRTLLELQCSPLDPAITKAAIKEAFSRAEGYDRDPNASEATRLSLALLHLVATDELPSELAIRTADAVTAASEQQIPRSSFGAVMTNPPYIKHDHLPPEERQVHKDYLGDKFKGRLDSYLTFIKLCLEATEPGGVACFVLPQTFMTAANAAPLRNQMTVGFDVKCLIDLSAVDVFEGVGAYSILVVVQRRTEGEIGASSAYVGQATEFVGAALQAVLDGRTIETPYYRVFEVSQEFFANREWVLVGPDAMALDRKLRSLPTLGDYAHCFQGFVTGADNVFIRSKSAIEPTEAALYMDYLPDRQIGRFAVPARVQQVVFYPYLGDELVSEATLKTSFPATWAYLTANKARLEKRRRSSSTPWWKPERPREPSRMRRPKIVSPHLMLTPCFAVDSKGRYATSHGPIVVLKDRGEEAALLYFLCGIMNSMVANWYLRTYVPSYSRGYSRLEPATLRSLPVPDLSQISPAQLQRFIELVRDAPKDMAAEDELDELAIEFYGLGSHERRALGRSL
jgi:hypothetical protein